MYDFGDIIGNASIVKALKAAITRDHIGHAYIFSGAAGCGKRLLALAFAKAVLCGSRHEVASACNACASCKTLESGNHPDVVFVRPSKKSMGVDDIRQQVLENAAILPYSSSRRVFIIQNADLMTVAAQNALLKTLEDGPKYAVFILLAQNGGVFLSTIVSRCVLYKIPPLADGAVQDYLIGQGIEREIAQMVATHAGGSVGRGMALAADDGFMALYKAMGELANDLDNKDIPGIFEAAKSLEAHKENISDALDMLALFYRGLMVAECGVDDLAYDDVKAVVRKIRAIDDARYKLSRNCNFLLTMEVMLLGMRSMTGMPVKTG